MMNRRTLLKSASTGSLVMIAGCVGSGSVVDETVIGGGNIFFEAESGDTVNFFAEVDGTGQGAGVVSDPDGNRVIEETITIETEASAETTVGGEHILTIAAGPGVIINVQISLE